MVEVGHILIMQMGKHWDINGSWCRLNCTMHFFQKGNEVNQLPR
jgi:hypothetical protein